MRCFKIAVLYILLAFNDCFSQNLVVNPSFEETKKCLKILELNNKFDNIPSMNITQPVGWSTTSEYSTSDIFQPCNEKTKVGSLDVNFQTPENNNGFQVARSGANYAGIFIYSDNHDDLVYREYLIGTLSQHLEAGKQYVVSAYVSLSENSEMATSELGFYFYDKVKKNNPLFTQVLPYIPQVENANDRILGNKKRWIRIEGVYTAKGGEENFAFGCFRDYETTKLVFLEEGKKEDIITSCFYYVDDICVALANDCGTLPEDADSSITLPYVPVTKGEAYIKGDFYDSESLKNISVDISHYLFNAMPNASYQHVGVFQDKVKKDTSYFTIIQADGYIPRIAYTESYSYINYLNNQYKHFYKGSTALSPVMVGVHSPLLHYYYFKNDKKVFIPYYDKELDVIADFLKKNESIKVKILSHGVIYDSLKYFNNLNSSAKVQFVKQHTDIRAKIIAKYLVNKGVDPTRITAEGRGNEDKYGDYLNEIVIVDAIAKTEFTQKGVETKTSTSMDKIRALDKIDTTTTVYTENSKTPQTTIEKIKAKEKCKIYGKISNAKNKLTLFAPVRVIDENEDYILANSVAGNFNIIVLEGTYTLFINKKGFIPYDTTITILKDSLYVPIGLRPIEVNESFTIDNILFEPSSYKLLSSSNKQLNKIYDFLMTNPTVVMGIYGHTDKGTSTSTEVGLQQLSEDRANEVMQYLLDKGIAPERLSKKGYGSTKPIAANDSQAGMAKNRRTEFVILGK